MEGRKAERREEREEEKKKREDELFFKYQQQMKGQYIYSTVPTNQGGQSLGCRGRYGCGQQLNDKV